MSGARIKIQLYFDEAAPEEFDDPEQALTRIHAVISKFNASQPIIFTVERGGSGIMYVGIGVTDRIFLSHTPADCNPPYNSSFKTDTPSKGQIEYYLHGQHHTEIDAKHLISSDRAFLGIEEFLCTGNLSTKIEWIED